MDPRRKRQLEILQQLEGGTAAMDAAEESGGTLPLPPPEEASDELDVAAPPVRQPLTPGAPAVLVERIADPVDEELAAAKGADVDSFNDRATETALRQLVAGITRTRAPDSVNQLGTAEKDLVGRRRQVKLDALREMEAGNNAARTEAYLKNNDAAAARAKVGDELAGRKLTLAETEAQRRDARAAAEEELKRADLERKKAADAVRAKRGSGKAPPAKGPDGKLLPTTFRDQQRADALQPRQGWEPIDAKAPTFRDSAQAKAFDTSVSAMGAIRNHRDHVLHELEVLKKAKTPGEADIAVGRLNAQLGALASKLRDAEGLNNTDAANHAIETMLSLQNGSAVNWKNVINEGRLPAILNAAIASGEANLDTIAESNNLRRAKSAAAAPGGHEAAAAGQSVVTLVDEKGEELDVDAGKAEALLAKHKNLRRK